MDVETYDLKELARLLNWNPAHCKVMVKQLGADPQAPIDSEIAAKVAKRIKRPWPPKDAN